ncbi:phenyl alanine ammonia-lyase 3, putative [Babesia ovata]|uniref:Phenyl alanine ammonia-lyase 3, putative n=1 Tax=Babesia ovata TaxID=189622 RepID=A0A2H6K7W4_9APIC|nr:phenyl alanine ammonia-lyase 3, putative [Babesia ovata]GBE59086.1 phenyl alanine ammonia-lyase 3, putative [Babesia ovata]
MGGLGAQEVGADAQHVQAVEHRVEDVERGGEPECEHSLVDPLEEGGKVLGVEDSVELGAEVSARALALFVACHAFEAPGTAEGEAVLVERGMGVLALDEGAAGEAVSCGGEAGGLLSLVVVGDRAILGAAALMAPGARVAAVAAAVLAQLVEQVVKGLREVDHPAEVVPAVGGGVDGEAVVTERPEVAAASRCRGGASDEAEEVGGGVVGGVGGVYCGGDEGECASQVCVLDGVEEGVLSVRADGKIGEDAAETVAPLGVGGREADVAETHWGGTGDAAVVSRISGIREVEGVVEVVASVAAGGVAVAEHVDDSVLGVRAYLMESDRQVGDFYGGDHGFTHIRRHNHGAVVSKEHVEEFFKNAGVTFTADSKQRTAVSIKEATNVSAVALSVVPQLRFFGTILGDAITGVPEEDAKGVTQTDPIIGPIVGQKLGTQVIKITVEHVGNGGVHAEALGCELTKLIFEYLQVVAKFVVEVPGDLEGAKQRGEGVGGGRNFGGVGGKILLALHVLEEIRKGRAQRLGRVAERRLVLRGLYPSAGVCGGLPDFRDLCDKFVFQFIHEALEAHRQVLGDKSVPCGVYFPVHCLFQQLFHGLAGHVQAPDERSGVPDGTGFQTPLHLADVMPNFVHAPPRSCELVEKSLLKAIQFRLGKFSVLLYAVAQLHEFLSHLLDFFIPHALHVPLNPLEAPGLLAVDLPVLSGPEGLGRKFTQLGGDILAQLPSHGGEREAHRLHVIVDFLRFLFKLAGLQSLNLTRDFSEAFDIFLVRPVGSAVLEAFLLQRHKPIGDVSSHLTSNLSEFPTY